MFHLNSTQLNTHTNKNGRACCCQNVPKKVIMLVKYNKEITTRKQRKLRKNIFR